MGVCYSHARANERPAPQELLARQSLSSNLLTTTSPHTSPSSPYHSRPHNLATRPSRSATLLYRHGTLRKRQRRLEVGRPSLALPNSLLPFVNAFDASHVRGPDAI